MAGVKITYGADSEEYAKLVGVDVTSAEAAARNILGVPSDAEVRLNGNSDVLGSTILAEGDEISFYKASGSKGRE